MQLGKASLIKTLSSDPKEIKICQDTSSEYKNSHSIFKQSHLLLSTYGTQQKRLFKNDILSGKPPNSGPLN